MTIIDVLPEFLKGKKIRRDSWSKDSYMRKDNVYIHTGFVVDGIHRVDTRYISEPNFTLDDINANDWIVKTE